MLPVDDCFPADVIFLCKKAFSRAALSNPSKLDELVNEETQSSEISDSSEFVECVLKTMFPTCRSPSKTAIHFNKQELIEKD